MERRINGPDKDWNTLAEVAAYLGISQPTLRTMIKKGEFPQGIFHGDRSVRWGWMDVVAYAHLKSRGFPPRKKKKRTPRVDNP